MIPNDSETSAPHLPQPRSSKIVSGGWGLSIAVVIVMIAAAVANTSMMGKADTRTATLETKIDGTVATLTEIKNQISDLTRSTQSELLTMQRDAGDLRTQVAREVGDLRVQIAEIRSTLNARSK